MISISIPTPLRSGTNGLATVDVTGATIGQALLNLVAAYPTLSNQLFDDNADLRRFVNIFVNDEDMRLVEGLETELNQGDRLQIVPAISGGSARGFSDWRQELATRVPQVDAQSVLAEGYDQMILVDVRSDSEWNGGHIPSATHIDRGFLEMQIATIHPDREARIVCYCASGARSLFAANTLLEMGYENVASLAGGIEEWRSAGGPLVTPAVLSEAQTERYKRQLSIPEVGPEGQRRLSQAKVLIVGLGGLGCPVSLYLAAAGVGRLGLVDSDVVDVSNLHRQVLYTDAMVGTSKVENAKQVLGDRNPHAQITDYQIRIDEDHAREIFPEYDVIVDGTDNFSARYCISDAAVELGKPVVHGSVYRFNGQVAVFDARSGPCYRCLFPIAPPPELAPSCAEGGVLGVLPGTIGLMMATETIKLLLGLSGSKSDTLYSYDAIGGELTTLRFGRDPHCAACASNHSDSPSKRERSMATTTAG